MKRPAVAPQSRRAAALVSSGLVLVAALIGGWWLAADDEPTPDESLAPTFVEPPPAPVAVAVEAPAPRVEAAAATGPRGEDEVEVCGLGWVPAAALEKDTLMTTAPAAVEARRRIVDSMAQSADDFDRAVSIWLRPDGDMPFTERNEQLARAAVTTTDPRVYGLAFRNCLNLPSREGSCALLSPEQWARLEPDNAMPWFYALDAADKRRDAAAGDEALYRMSVAPRLGDGNFAPAAAASRHAADDDASILAAYLLSAESVGSTVALSVSYQTLVRHCNRDQVADGNRRQVCEAIATLMRNRSDTALSSTIGRSLAGHLGEPDEVLEPDKADTRKLMSQSAQEWPRSLSCTDMRRAVTWFNRVAEIGEIKALREQVARTTFVAAGAQR